MQPIVPRSTFYFSGFSIPFALPILLVYIVAGAFVNKFLSIANVTSILFSAAVLLPAVITTQLLLVLGKFDLSIGATASLAGMIAGTFFQHYGSLPTALCCAILAGVVVGGIGGTIVSRLGVDPLIATLALMGVGRSGSLALNDGRVVAGLPEVLDRITEMHVAGIPLLILVGLIFITVAALLTGHVVLLRRFYAIGNNPVAASHAGLNVATAITIGYILAGIGAAGTGLIQLSRTLSASPLLFQTLAIDAIAACILGGGSLLGGRGGVWGASLGLIVIVATENLVIMLGIPVYWKDFSVGALLLFAVLVRPVREKVEQLLRRKSQLT